MPDIRSIRLRDVGRIRLPGSIHYDSDERNESAGDLFVALHTGFELKRLVANQPQIHGAAAIAYPS
jgi:hypothetical protein